MAQESGFGLLEVFPSQLLQDPQDGCQPIRLGRSSRHPVGAGNMFIIRVPSSEQHPRTSGILSVSTILDHAAGGPSDRDSDGQHLSSGVHLPLRRNNKSVHGKRARLDPVLSELNVPALSVVCNPGITWDVFLHFGVVPRPVL